MAVRDNPGHACLCLADPMKPETMACSRENDGEPNRNDCKTYCGSRVYTDTTVAEDKKEAAQLRDRLHNVNPILAARIGNRIRHLEVHIAEHETKALPLVGMVKRDRFMQSRNRAVSVSRGRSSRVKQRCKHQGHLSCPRVFRDAERGANRCWSR